MVKISFIIVNYKTPLLLQKCIDALINAWDNYEIIVVDNGYDDEKNHESSELVKKEYGKNKKIILVSTLNEGISAGNNKGLKYATGEYLCFLGTDAYPSKYSMNDLIEYMEKEENKKVGIVTPMLVLNDGEIDWDAHRGFSTPWSSLTHFMRLDKLFPKSKLFNQYFLGYQDFTKPHEIDVCISHFMLMRSEVMKKLKKWDEDYWVYGEDLDTCYRTKELGYKIMYLPHVKVLHLKGATVGRKESKDVKGKAVLTSSIKKKLTGGSVEVMKMFYTKHLAKKYPFILNWIVYFGIWCMSLLRNIVKKH